MIKRLLLTFLLLAATLFAVDARLKNYPNAVQWEQEATKGDADAMYNLGHTYQTKVKDFDKAIYWYKKAYEQDKGSDAANNIGYLYKEQKQYDNAILWYQKAIAMNHALSSYNLAYLYDEILKKPKEAIPYYKKAYSMGKVGSAHSLAYLYDETFKQPDKAKQWYEKAAKGGYKDSMNNLGVLYRDQGDNIHAGAYFLALIAYGEPKKDILDFLKNDWKLDRDTLQKAYELQKTLDIPKHYTGGID